MTILSKLYQNKFFEILTTAAQLQFLYMHLTWPLHYINCGPDLGHGKGGPEGYYKKFAHWPHPHDSAWWPWTQLGLLGTKPSHRWAKQQQLVEVAEVAEVQNLVGVKWGVCTETVIEKLL